MQGSAVPEHERVQPGHKPPAAAAGQRPAAFPLRPQHQRAIVQLLALVRGVSDVFARSADVCQEVQMLTDSAWTGSRLAEALEGDVHVQPQLLQLQPQRRVPLPLAALQHAQQPVPSTGGGDGLITNRHRLLE